MGGSKNVVFRDLEGQGHEWQTWRYAFHDFAPRLFQSMPADTVRPEATLMSPTSAGPFRQVELQVDAADVGGLDRIVANVYRGSTLVKSTQTTRPASAP